jgi:hypothetical protein
MPNLPTSPPNDTPATPPKEEVTEKDEPTALIYFIIYGAKPTSLALSMARPSNNFPCRSRYRLSPRRLSTCPSGQ